MKFRDGWMAGGVLLLLGTTAFAQPPVPRPYPAGPPAPPVPMPYGAPMPYGSPLPPGPPLPAGPPESAPGFSDFQRPYTFEQLSFIYVEPPPPRVVKVHDLVTIVVSEKSQVTVNSNFNRQRNATYKAQLNEFIRLGETGNLATAAPNQPTIDGTLQGRVQSMGQLNDSEGITYRIAAEVVDVQPNGVLVLEARKIVRSNRELWEYTLTGRVRSEDINRDNTAVSEDIANLEITKRTRGKVNDSTQRPWGAKLWDRIFPF